jgi:hypothetical protein
VTVTEKAEARPADLKFIGLIDEISLLPVIDILKIFGRRGRIEEVVETGGAAIPVITKQPLGSGRKLFGDLVDAPAFVRPGLFLGMVGFFPPGKDVGQVPT